MAAFEQHPCPKFQSESNRRECRASATNHHSCGMFFSLGAPKHVGRGYPGPNIECKKKTHPFFDAGTVGKGPLSNRGCTLTLDVLARHVRSAGGKDRFRNGLALCTVCPSGPGAMNSAAAGCMVLQLRTKEMPYCKRHSTSIEDTTLSFVRIFAKCKEYQDDSAKLLGMPPKMCACMAKSQHHI